MGRTRIKQCQRKVPSIESVPITTVPDVPASLLVITYALVCGRVCKVGSRMTGPLRGSLGNPRLFVGQVLAT